MSLNKDFVETYNNINWSMEELIGNNDTKEKTNRFFYGRDKRSLLGVEYVPFGK